MRYLTSDREYPHEGHGFAVSEIGVFGVSDQDSSQDPDRIRVVAVVAMAPLTRMSREGNPERAKGRRDWPTDGQSPEEGWELRSAPPTPPRELEIFVGG